MIRWLRDKADELAALVVLLAIVSVLDQQGRVCSAPSCSERSRRVVTDPSSYEPARPRQERAEEPDGQLVSPAGYLRHLVELYQGTAGTTLRLDETEAESFDPATDAPYTVIDMVRLVDPDTPDTPR